jgi:hypothetical protein
MVSNATVPMTASTAVHGQGGHKGSRGPATAKPFRPRGASRRVRAWQAGAGLAAVALLGVGMRLLPLASSAVWGSDTGEYHRLTEGLLRDGRMTLDYHGWGIAYPWFPGLYSVAGAVSATTGLDTRASLELLVPGLAGLAALAGALLAYELARDARAALLAGAALAVAMPHAFATSHAMPGALGHLLLVATLLLVWDGARDRLSLAAGGLCALALVATHHLSAFMLLAALGGMVAARAVLSARPDAARHRAELAALALTLAAAVAWWSWARPVREQLVPHASSLGLAGLAALAALGMVALALVPRLRARWTWRFRPRFPSARGGLGVVAAMFLVVLGGSAVVGFVRVPGTSVRLAPFAVLWFLPLAALLGFGFLGSGLAKFRPRGMAVYGWALALLASFALAMLAESTVLLPYRHAEYILEPAALLAGLGLAAALGYAARRGRGLGTLAAAGAVGLLALNGALAYPPPAVLAGFQEGTSQAEMDAVRWAALRVDLAPDAVIAADHRVSSMLFGFAGLNATWEYAPRTFLAESFEEARMEMEAVRAPSGVKRVDYVFLSAGMAQHLALRQWEPAAALGPGAAAKFTSDPRYDAVCQGKEVAIYRVVWSPPPAELAAPPRAPAPPCAP